MSTGQHWQTLMLLGCNTCTQAGRDMLLHCQPSTLAHAVADSVRGHACVHHAALTSGWCCRRTVRRSPAPGRCPCPAAWTGTGCRTPCSVRTCPPQATMVDEGRADGDKCAWWHRESVGGMVMYCHAQQVRVQNPDEPLPHMLGLREPLGVPPPAACTYSSGCGTVSGTSQRATCLS